MKGLEEGSYSAYNLSYQPKPSLPFEGRLTVKNLASSQWIWTYQQPGFYKSDPFVQVMISLILKFLLWMYKEMIFGQQK